MTLFYDPKTKKVKVWVIVAFILIPIILFIVVCVVGQNAVQNKKNKPSKEETDVFKKI